MLTQDTLDELAIKRVSHNTSRLLHDDYLRLNTYHLLKEWRILRPIYVRHFCKSLPPPDSFNLPYADSELVLVDIGGGVRNCLCTLPPPFF